MKNKIVPLLRPGWFASELEKAVFTSMYYGWFIAKAWY